MNSRVELYHCNSEDVLSNFKDGQLVISSHPHDDDWGGSGMYFWDNLGNAHYWKSQKKHDTKIIKCYIEFNYTEDLLDLTDIEQERRFEWVIEHPRLAEAPIGKKIDFYCKKFGIKLVKFFGKYPKTPKTKIFDSDDINSKLTNQVKVIYCIKESSRDIILNDIVDVQE